MAEYDIIPCYDDDELFQEKHDTVTDLHAYYMSQFNLELENSNKSKKVDNFKYGVEESFDFEVIDGWNNNNAIDTDFEMIDKVIDSNINEQNIKEVLLDLDNIDFEGANKDYQEPTYESNDYIDDESLIDELCREDNESCRLTPDRFAEEYTPNPEKNSLPSIDTVFSKRYSNYSIKENTIEDISTTVLPSNGAVNSIEHYSYPNNILHNLDSDKRYVLPDTPTSCNEFNFDRNERKISVSESIESDLQSSCYYDENSETFEEDELFVNLDDFGLTFEGENDVTVNIDTRNNNNSIRKVEKEKAQGKAFFARTCMYY